MESNNNQVANPSSVPSTQEVDFNIGRNKAADDKKKKKKAEDVAEKRLQEHFHVGASSKDNDELKRKREEFAENLRKKKR